MLYSYQASLPRLPLPSLKSTLTRYLKSVKPLESEEDYQRLVKEAEEFENGIGKKLQRYLSLKSWWASNYVSDWWEEYVYLRGRQPIMVNSNYYGMDALFLKHTTYQASRAANLIYSAMMFRRMIDRQELAPIMVQGLVPLCSWQYERLFNTTRIPGVEGDRLHHLADSQHIVIMHRGRFFRLDLYYKQKLLLPKQLESLIEKIINDKNPPTLGEAHLGALTAADRVTWATKRTEFFSKGINRISLNAIENAAFVLVLDDVDYEFKRGDDTGLSRIGQILLHGQGHDRWFDKSFNFIISKNGRAGFNAEHSWADAPIMAHLWEFILSYELENLGYDDEGRCRLGNGNGIEPPVPLRLKWDIPEELISTIENCRLSAENLLKDVDLRLMVFTDYGKGFIKTCKVSPDAYVQLAFQLAYFRGCGKFCLTYEASMTRLFREGRTETVRPVTCDSAAFVRAMNDGNMSKKDKIDLMKKASAVHQKGYQDAMCGKGIDRHLFCLYVISKYLEVDSPFLKEVRF
jgi:carnitine O-palmitoyltransferase 1